MIIRFLQNKRWMRAVLFALLLGAMGMTKAMAQRNETSNLQSLHQEATIEFDITEISVFDERVFFLYNLLNDSRFSVITSEEDGVFIISASDAYETLDLDEAFTDFREQNAIQFSEIDKSEASEIAYEYKAQLPNDFIQSLMMDVYIMSRMNNMCASAEQICTDNGIYEFPAGVNAGSGESGPYYGCLSTQPNPAWFYLEIGNPGNIDIYMYSTPSKDLDFCCWGPFTDPISPCPNGLTSNKVVSCSYSTSSSEHCIIPSTAQTGQIYIMVITNYSNGSCNISFSQVAGSGSMGCSGQKLITANVNPAEGGTVTGAGEYEYGSTCTLTAIANPGYMFMDWTDENGNVISTDEEYSFTVSNNRTFTANFVEDNACYLTFYLNDTDGDGWSGNYLVLNFEDGFTQKLTVPYGLSASSYSLPIADGSHITLGWISGANTDQCSFLVSYSNGNGIYNGTDLDENLNYEFDVDCVEMPAMFYTISATANPSTGGTISCNLNHMQTEDFETGNFSQFDWQLDATYPWSITTTNPYEGTYCMKSGGVGVANVVSNMTVSIDIPANSEMSFFGKISSESTYDKGHFFIDGVEKGQYSGADNWTERTFPITAGNHTFQWRYTKDNMVDSNDDCFYIDNITFCKKAVAGASTNISCNQGDTCTLRAFPNIGYAFENWKENDNVISTDAEFSFIVNSNRSFVANFTKVPLTITAIPNFENRGTVTGAGEYLIDDTCTLTATANAGFAFANWTKNGAIVSTDAEYTFIVVDTATFVANFVTDGNIVFADANVKNICVSQWDTNGDGELSYVEAAHVVDLGNYFQGNTQILMFNELQYFIGLSSIGANAFNNCTGLTLITLPSTLTSIGNNAFYNCSGLIGGLTIPNAVTTIGNYAFYNCSGFMGLLTIGNSVTSIGNSAFEGCRNFTGSINIPNSVVNIGSNAFKGCTAFWGTLTIGNSVTTIGSEAFSGCTGLVGDIVIPNSVISIGSNAFYNCHSFGGTLTLGNSVTTIGSSAFYSCYGLTGDLVIPNSVTSIGNSAFYNCYGFTGALIIGNSVTSIGSSAFYNCSGFAGTLTIGNSVTTIGSSAFEYCDGFTGNLDIPNSVTSIGSSAFYDCDGFVGGSLTIPSSVTSIGGEAFYSCSGFSEIYYNVTSHADISEGYYNYPFQNCSGHLNIGNNVVRIAANMFRNANFTGILTIPNSVVAINDNAFNNCWHLTGTLVIPNSINTIGISAFQDCDGLSEIIMGNNVMIVGNTAFYSCSGLTKVTLPEPVTVIGIEAFRNCTQLSEVNMQSMQAPSIGWDVFSNNATGRIINIPCGATENYSSGYWEEWASALNEMCDGYDITVVVNPAEAGSVTGAGTYEYSQMCTLTAMGNLGYPFINWTKNGVVVSTETTYSFGVTESCTYVANFSQTPVSYDIAATANLEDGGTVTGAGSYLHGATVTLEATANEGYTFINWTKNGEVVSSNSTYSFTVTEAGSYVANFELNTYEITVTANPVVGGMVEGSGTYEHFSTCVLIATANQGYSFVNWTQDGEEVSIDPIYYFTVTENAAYVANFSENNITQTTDLSQGWNWWSTYVEQEGIDGLTMLEESLGENGYQIKSQTDFVTNYGSMWFGMLGAITNEETYMIDNTTDCQIEMTGAPVSPADHPITINNGWNWIGYPSTHTMGVAEALADFSPTNGDQIKSQSNYSVYYNSMWMGQLQSITPGTGLMYKSNNTESTTLVYPDGSRNTEAATSAKATHWTNDIHAYPHNMTVMAVVELDEVELTTDNYELAVFANGECRGSVKLTYVEPLDRRVAFLTIAGNDAVELAFRLYDAETGAEYYDAEESLSFTVNATVGDPEDVFVVHFRGATGMDELSSSVQVYPNPVQAGERISVGMTISEKLSVRVEITNTLGSILSMETSKQLPVSINAPNTAGVYMLRISVEGKGTCYRKVIVR